MSALHRGRASGHPDPGGSCCRGVVNNILRQHLSGRNAGTQAEYFFAVLPARLNVAELRSGITDQG